MNPITIEAQTYAKWARSFGRATNFAGSFDDEANSVSIDEAGNVYTTGFFRDTVDFDPGPGTFNLISVGDFDIFIQKLDSSGNFLWARSFGGTSRDEGNTISTDRSGNVYTTGFFRDTVDFDPGAGVSNLISSGGSDVFIQKLDSSGNFLWARSFGGTLRGGNSTSIDASGNVYTTGGFSDTVDFDPGAGVSNLISLGASDVFIQKLGSSGNFLWARSIGGDFSAVGKSISVDVAGNVYTSGVFRDTVDFDPGAGDTFLSSKGDDDIFVQKMDASGNFLWARSYGGINRDEPNSISTDASGNVYTTGGFLDTIDFDPGLGVSNLISSGASDVFVQKLDSSGNFLWARSFGGTMSDYSTSISADDAGNVYTTGVFLDTVDFDPGQGEIKLISSNGSSVFVQQLDPSGNFQWAESTGGTLTNSISTDRSGNVYTTGIFDGTLDFNPGPATISLTAAGLGDIFVQKLSRCSTKFSVDTINACGFYTWIDGITYTTSNNTASYTITDTLSGCDSVVNLNLTINNPSVSADVIKACNSYTWINGITYTSSNTTAKDTLVNEAGCDSIVLLVLTIDSVSDITTSLTNVTITANNEKATYQWLACDSNYTVINGETAQSFTPIFNGNYAVELTENGCVDTSACVLVSSIGIVENTFGNQFRVYPNPTKGDFTIDLGIPYERAEVQIIDMAGKVIQRSNYNATQLIELNLNEAPGLYFIQLISGDKKAVIRMMKE